MVHKGMSTVLAGRSTVLPIDLSSECLIYNLYGAVYVFFLNCYILYFTFSELSLVGLSVDLVDNHCP